MHERGYEDTRVSSDFRTRAHALGAVEASSVETLCRTTKRAAGAQGCRAAAAIGRFGAGWAGKPSPSNLTRRAQRHPARFRQAIKNHPKAVSLFPGESGEIRTHEQFNPSLVFKSEKYSFNIN